MYIQRITQGVPHKSLLLFMTRLVETKNALNIDYQPLYQISSSITPLRGRARTVVLALCHLGHMWQPRRVAGATHGRILGVCHDLS